MFLPTVREAIYYTAAQCIVIDPVCVFVAEGLFVCLWVCAFVCGGRRGSVTTITRNCVHRSYFGSAAHSVCVSSERFFPLISASEVY